MKLTQGEKIKGSEYIRIHQKYRVLFSIFADMVFNAAKFVLRTRIGKFGGFPPTKQ